MNLTPRQAYLAMFAFLDGYWRRGKSEEIGALLGALSLLENDRPADPALAADWDDAVRLALADSVDARMRLSEGR